MVFTQIQMIKLNESRKLKKEAAFLLGLQLMIIFYSIYFIVIDLFNEMQKMVKNGHHSIPEIILTLLVLSGKRAQDPKILHSYYLRQR